MKFTQMVHTIAKEPLTAGPVKILQANTGNRCNQSCKHCHVEAGPLGTKVMTGRVMADIIAVLASTPVKTLDVTGGAPELTPGLRFFLQEARSCGATVMVRTNLTVFYEEGMENYPEFYRDLDITLITSLPSTVEDVVDRVRGKGAFQKILAALRRLNTLGYGTGQRSLSLVYNPPGILLPPGQKSIEEEYRKELARRYGVHFDNLYALCNVPAGRFAEHLRQSGNLDKYLDKLRCSFNPANLDHIMCRSLVSVDAQGVLHDCDFNLAMGIPVASGYPGHVQDFSYHELSKRPIVLDDHCYACTAGQGFT